MNVAVCLSGLTRSVSYTWPLIERYLVRPFNSSVFLHTWDIDHGGERFNCTMKGIVPSPSFVDGRNKTEFIEQEIKPKVYEIENYDAFSLTNSGIIAKAMYYSIYKANSFKQKYEKNTGQNFDIVIRSRMDVFYETFLDKNELLDTLENKVIYGCLPGNKPDHRFITDAFGFGSNASMDIYAQTWLKQPIQGPPAEIYLQNQLISNGINFKWSKMRYKMTFEWNERDVKAWGDF